MRVGEPELGVKLEVQIVALRELDVRSRTVAPAIGGDAESAARDTGTCRLELHTWGRREMEALAVPASIWHWIFVMVRVPIMLTKKAGSDCRQDWREGGLLELSAPAM